MAAALRPRGAGHLSRLVVVSLLLMVASVHPAASWGTVYSEGSDVEAAYALALEAGLFGRFTPREGGLTGDFVEVTFGDQRGLGAVVHQGRPLLERLDVPLTPTNLSFDGPLVTIHDDDLRLQLHDNRYGWMSLDGTAAEARLVFAPGSELVAVPGGLAAQQEDRTVFVHYDGGGFYNLTMEGEVALFRPQGGVFNLTIALAQGIHTPGLRSGAWTLLAASDGAYVADVLRPHEGGHRPRDVSAGGLAIDMVPMPTDATTDAAHRIDSAGVFPSPARIHVRDAGDHLFRNVNASLVFRDEDSFAAVNATTRDGVTTILLRQPYDLGGDVHLVHDPRPPRILRIVFENTTGQWEPMMRPPTLRIQADEPINASAVFEGVDSTHMVRQGVHSTDLRIDLADLDPATEYVWRLTIRDRAGNIARSNGTLLTPTDVSRLVPQVTIREPTDGAVVPTGEPVVVRATVTDGRGRPLPPGHIQVEVDGRNHTTNVEWDGTALALHLGLMEDGPHTVGVQAVGHDPRQVVRDEISFVVGSGTGLPFPPMPLVLGLVALLAATGRRLAHR